jgi:hypothetical protein
MLPIIVDVPVPAKVNVHGVFDAELPSVDDDMAFTWKFEMHKLPRLFERTLGLEE